MAAAQRASSSVVSCSRHSSFSPVVRSAAASRRSHVVRVAEPSTFAAAPLADAGVADPLPPRAAQREYKPLTAEDLVDRPDSLQKIADYKLPQGYHWYETMIVLRAMMDDKGRDEQLAKFEAYLNKEGCMHINCLVKNRSRMAYPMKKDNWDGIYVLYTYAAKRQTARSVQLLLSNPEAGSEDKILRHITFCRL